MLQDGGCASRQLATRVTRQRRRYMICSHGTVGWRLGLEGLSTVGADVQVGGWPVRQQAGQDTPQQSSKRIVYVTQCIVCGSTNFKFQQDSVNPLFNPNAFFLFLLTGATW